MTDGDGDSVTIAITSIFQDEPTTGSDSGDAAPDGLGVGTAMAQVRAERAGDGRVYHVEFSADNGNGGQCSGVVTVGVPHSMVEPAVDGGAVYDSTSGT